MKGRGCCVRNIGHEHDFCQTQKTENTDPRTNDAVKYATARGHLSVIQEVRMVMSFFFLGTPAMVKNGPSKIYWRALLCTPVYGETPERAF